MRSGGGGDPGGRYRPDNTLMSVVWGTVRPRRDLGVKSEFCVARAIGQLSSDFTFPFTRQALSAILLAYMADREINSLLRQPHTMKRLKGFDYRRPFFYMVTLKRLKGLRDFAGITTETEPATNAKGQGRYLIPNEITVAFAKEIREFTGKWRGLGPIESFIIMPDHIHLLLHIVDSGDQLSLGKYVYQLMKALSVSYWQVGNPGSGAGGSGRTVPPGQHSDAGGGLGQPSGDGERGGILGVAGDRSVVLPVPSVNSLMTGNLEPVFEHDWHDWIVKKDGQLAAFTRYIRENPFRSWLRQQNRQYFGRVRKVSFLGREWFAYGNLALFELPVLMAVRGHRTTVPGSPEWNAMLEDCARLGPGCAGVGTFMSPLEKACGNAIAEAGGRWIVLSPEGFQVRWHPPRERERFCAEGRMLFLSLYEALDHLPTKQELHRRCHEMGDLAVAGLPEAGCRGIRADGTARTTL